MDEQAMYTPLKVEVAGRGVEIFSVFHSLVCRAILGVYALQWSGLRSITDQNLSMASRTIALALHILWGSIELWRMCYDKARPRHHNHRSRS